MNYRYVGLRIFNNFNWLSTLRELEKRGYLWASRDKPTRLYFSLSEGTIYIDPITKTLALSNTHSLSMHCNCYITMK